MSTHNNLSEEDQDKARAKVIAQEILNKRKFEDKKDSVKAASNFIFVVFVFNLLSTLALYAMEAGVLMLTISGVFTLVLLVLGILSKKSPFVPILIAFSIYLLLTLLEALTLDPGAYMRLLFKFIPLSILGYGTYNAWQTRKNNRQKNPDILDDIH